MKIYLLYEHGGRIRSLHMCDDSAFAGALPVNNPDGLTLLEIDAETFHTVQVARTDYHVVADAVVKRGT